MIKPIINYKKRKAKMMTNKYISFKFICQVICFVVLIPAPLSPAFAQNRNMNLSQDRFITNDKFKQFDKLGMVEKKELFDRLSSSDKALIFQRFSTAEKKMIFDSLHETEKKDIFNNLNDDDKALIFKNLGETEKDMIFSGLSDDDKKLIYDSLSDMEQREMLLKYPGLHLIIISEELIQPPEEAVQPVEKVSPPSRMEEILSGMFPTDISRKLRQYGYDFFKKDTSTFAPIMNVPVGSDYIIGPDDNFKINLWGKAEQTYNVTVDRDGRITIPRLGAVSVAGLTFSEMKSLLSHKFKEYYPAFDMSISMGRLRTVQIFIVGESENPGTYSVSSLSTVITALFAAGGPGKNGSMRNIHLIRNGKLIKEIDLYDFFLKGDKKQDTRLEPGDTIFIPVIGPVVGVAGNVRRPAIYEMHGNQSVSDIIAVAGGVLPVGYLQNVVVERIEDHRRRIVKNFNVGPNIQQAGQQAKEELNTLLKDGDLVKIYPVHNRIRNVVYLEGHVKYPRKYEYKPGLHVSDLIPSFDYLLPEPFLPQAEIMRLVPPDFHPEVVEFDLSKMLAGNKEHDLLLHDLDRVIIYHRWEKKNIPQIVIQGEVNKPGTFRLYRSMTIKDLIFRADNLTKKAFLDKGTLSRVIKGKKGTETIKFDFAPNRAMSGLSPDNMLLEPDDIIYIREIPQYSQALARKVYLEGEFLFPGEYTFSEGERLSSLIERAGGLTEEAYPFGAIFQRDSVKKVQQERLRGYIEKLEEDVLTLGVQTAGTAVDKEEAAVLQQTLKSQKQLLEKIKTASPTGRMVINLPEVIINTSSNNNFTLRAGDRLIVNKRADYVNVLGEVYNPTALFAEKDEDVEYYLDMVGGATDNAAKGQIYVVKANGSVISKSQEGFLGLASWDPANHRWTMGGFDSIKADPGDTIIVPKKVERYPWLRVTKDITEILFRIAVSAGVIIAAY